MWNKTKQTYWINRYRNPWSIIRVLDNEYVCDIAPFVNDAILRQICFAKTDDDVMNIAEAISKESYVN